MKLRWHTHTSYGSRSETLTQRHTIPPLLLQWVIETNEWCFRTQPFFLSFLWPIWQAIELGHWGLRALGISSLYESKLHWLKRLSLPPSHSPRAGMSGDRPENEMDWNELKWTQIFKNIDSRILKWMLFNPAFLFIYRNCMEHISMLFNLKIILAFPVHYTHILNTVQFKILNRKCNFLIQLNLIESN